MKIRSILVLLLTGVATGIAQNSDIVAVSGSEAGTIAYVSKQAVNIATTSDGVKVWSIKVRDGGASSALDFNNTYLVNLTLAPAGSNTVTWGSTIRHAALFNGSTRVATASTSMLFTDDSDDADGVIVDVPDGDSVTLDLYLSFTTTAVDWSQFQFSISAVTDDDGFIWTGGTTIGSYGATSSIASNANTILVTASKLSFVGVPSSVKPNENFAATVEAQDANGNKDTDATPSVTLSIYAGPGLLTSTTGLTQSLVAGSYSWSDLRLDTEDPNVSLAASDGIAGLSDAVSTDIEVTSMLVIEDFDEHTVGDPLTNNGWSALGAGDPVTTFGSALSFTGYASSGIANSAYIHPGKTQEAYFPFTSVNSGSIYLAFMVSINIVGSSGFPLVSLSLPSPSAVSDLRLVVYARYSSGSGMAFGISKNWNVPKYTAYDYDQGPTYLIVAKYEFNGGTNDDVGSLFVNPVLNQMEPGSPTITADSSGDVADVSSFGAVAILQQGGTDALVDGIRVMTNWSEYALPIQLASFSATVEAMSTRLAWSTSTERNNAGFSVERRRIEHGGVTGDGFRSIAFVPGAGTSTSPREYSHTDANVPPGRYAYRIKQVDRDGSTTIYREAEVEIGLTAKAFTLNEAFPNPFNPATSLDFSLAEAGPATVKIYDLLGREVATIFNAAAEAGRLYRATWDASSMPSGMYFARLESGNASAMKKLMLVK